jgi:hypothetical protein
MPRFIGMTCVKNEAQWIEKVLAAQHFCERIIVMDDHSTDMTAEICRSFANVEVINSPFADYQEGRNNTFLAEKVAEFSPDWVVNCMGDEVLEPSVWHKIEPHASREDINVFRFSVINMWSATDVRVDHQWAKRQAPTIWRFPKNTKLTYYAMHCALPEQIECDQRPHPSEPVIVPLSLTHWGYSSPELRQQAYDFFMERDPGRASEYIHLLDSDPELVPLSEYLRRT